MAPTLIKRKFCERRIGHLPLSLMAELPRILIGQEGGNLKSTSQIVSSSPGWGVLLT